MTTSRLLSVPQIRSAAPFAALWLAGCANLYGAGPQPPQDPHAVSDTNQIERMEQLRAKANQSSAAADAVAFDQALQMLHLNEVDKRRTLPLPKLVDEAAACLDRARKGRPEEAYRLLAEKGELYVQFGRHDEGYAALRESMEARPNLQAFDILGKSYKETNAVAELEQMCTKTLPVMETRKDRYIVLDRCLTYSGASTIEGGLRWASKKDVQFYREMTADLDRSREAFYEQQRADDQRQNEERRAELDQRRSESASCQRQCESVHSLCKSGCGSGPTGCWSECERDATNCRRSCR